MNIVNIAEEIFGAKIIQASSQANLILSSAGKTRFTQDVWITNEGLPQYLIISLENVTVPYSQIVTVGIYCWHNYESNPKTIQLWIKPKQQDEFVYWTTINLKNQIGQQLFPIDPIPNHYTNIKVVITQTFGAFQTYLNQLIIYAKNSLESTVSKQIKHSLLSLEHTDKDQLQFQGSPIQNQKSLQKNTVILTLSKNLIEIEQQINRLYRRVDQMQIKIDVSHNNLQNNLMKKVKIMIEEKIKKVQSPQINHQRKPRMFQLAQKLNKKLQQRAMKIQELKNNRKIKKHNYQ